MMMLVVVVMMTMMLVVVMMTMMLVVVMMMMMLVEVMMMTMMLVVVMISYFHQTSGRGVQVEGWTARPRVEVPGVGGQRSSAFQGIGRGEQMMMQRMMDQ